MKAARLVFARDGRVRSGWVCGFEPQSARAEPRSMPWRSATLDLDAFIAEHNRNADLIQSLKAEPTIAVKSKSRTIQADGKLGMVPPRNFKLELSAHGPDEGQHRVKRPGILVLGAERRRPIDLLVQL